MAVKIKIKDSKKLMKILHIFSALDDIRWSQPSNYNQINHCSDDLTPDEKLLTHWICYITDRQMGFERIWDVGGFVLSHLVRNYRDHQKNPEQLFMENLRSPTGKQGFRLECSCKKLNTRLNQYNIQTGPVEFSSRYMPSDCISILRTLLILDHLSDRSFVQFIYNVIHAEKDYRIAIKRLAAAFHFLTYANIGQINARGLKKSLKKLISDIDDQIKLYEKDEELFIKNCMKSFKPFDKKRLWCSIRDYLKSPEFNHYLVKSLNEIDPKEAKRWNRDNPSLKRALDVIELPGDVWNNNRLFREGLFTPFISKIPKSWDMPRAIRKLYDQIDHNKTTFYPEQLDVTFDFVPRMCGTRMCRICIFGAGISKLCHSTPDILCPVALSSCGYLKPCDPDTCHFKENSVAGVCKEKII